MKPLLSKDTEDAIVNRVLQLSPSGKALWGGMSVNQMLFHCKKIHTEILQAGPQEINPTVKQKMMKTVGLYLMKAFPKGIQTGSKYLPGPTANIEFEQVQRALIENIKEVCDCSRDIHGSHPFFGPLNKRVAYFYVEAPGSSPEAIQCLVGCFFNFLQN